MSGTDLPTISISAGSIEWLMRCGFRTRPHDDASKRRRGDADLRIRQGPFHRVTKAPHLVQNFLKDSRFRHRLRDIFPASEDDTLGVHKVVRQIH